MKEKKNSTKLKVETGVLIVEIFPETNFIHSNTQFENPNPDFSPINYTNITIDANSSFNEDLLVEEVKLNRNPRDINLL